MSEPTSDQIPGGYELTRTTATFDNDTVPPGLLSAHRVANGVWGRLVVHSGALDFVFEDQPGTRMPVGDGGHVVIPPARPHHLELNGPVSFAVEFYRSASPSLDNDGAPESSGLGPPTE